MFENLTGSVASCFHAKFGKYWSTVRPFTVNLPEPGRRNTRAMDSLRRPVPRNQVLLDASELKLPPHQTSETSKTEKTCLQTARPSSAKNFFELHARLIPCEGLHLPRVEGQPTCGNFRARLQKLKSRAAGDSVPYAAPIRQ